MKNRWQGLDTGEAENHVIKWNKDLKWVIPVCVCESTEEALGGLWPVASVSLIKRLCSPSAVWFQSSLGALKCERTCLPVEENIELSSWQVSASLLCLSQCAREFTLCVLTALNSVLWNRREQLPAPAPVHPPEAMLLPGLQRDPRPAPHNVQEALLPLDLWVDLCLKSRGSAC